MYATRRDSSTTHECAAGVWQPLNSMKFWRAAGGWGWRTAHGKHEHSKRRHAI